MPLTGTSTIADLNRHILDCTTLCIIYPFAGNPAKPKREIGKYVNLPNRQRLGAAVLIISGIAAFVAPFLIHSPPTQGNIGPGPDNGNNNNNNDNGETGQTTSPPGGNPGGGQGGGPKKSLKDLMDGVMSCGTEPSGYQRSLSAKVESAMRADHSTRTDHHLEVLKHQLDTPAAEKHAGGCISDLKSLIDGLLPS